MTKSKVNSISPIRCASARLKGLGRSASWTAAATAVLLAVMASPALAGSNGQQIAITPWLTPSPAADRCFGNANYAFIDGYNQSGAHRVWQGYLNNGALAKGWWWKGNVTVSLWNPQRQLVSQILAWVPTGDDTRFELWPTQIPNTVGVTCIGTMEHGSSIIKLGTISDPGCVNLESNPLGVATEYRHYIGYYGINGINQDGTFIGYPSSIAGTGSAPPIVTETFSTFECE